MEAIPVATRAEIRVAGLLRNHLCSTSQEYQWMAADMLS